MTSIGKFKNHLQITIQDIKSYLDNDNEFNLHEFKINTAMSIDPRSSVKWFMDCLVPFADEILKGNDSFFLQTEFGDMDENYVSIVSKIKTIWTTLDNSGKNNIKRNFKLLLMLGAIAVKNEDLRLIINKHRDPANPLEF